MKQVMALFVVAALLFAGHAESAAVLQMTPRFNFKTRAAATVWGVKVGALELRYNAQDPVVARIAKEEVFNMSLAFQAKYKKQWSPNEAQQRLQTFTENLWKIGEINRNSKKLGWWAAQTKFADLSTEEFARKYLMNQFKEPVINKNLIDLKYRLILGEKVDWNAKGKVTPIRDQFACGSCWAMAAAAAMESRYLIKKGLTATAYNLYLSVQQLVDCVRSPRTDTSGNVYTSGGCGGGWSQDAFNYARKFNVTMNSVYPYTGVDGTCKQRVLTSAGLPTKVLKQSTPNPGWYQITYRNTTAMRIATKYTPIVFYMRVEGAFHLYSGGIFQTPCTGTNINHAMLIYGYYRPILISGTPYWLVKNSWGTGWGESGKIKIKMDLSGGGINDGLCSMHKWSYYPNDNSMILPLLIPVRPPIIKP